MDLGIYILAELLEWDRLTTFQRELNHTSAPEERLWKYQPCHLADCITIKTRIESLWHEYNDEATHMNPPIPLKTVLHGSMHVRNIITAPVVAYFGLTYILHNVVALQSKNIRLELDGQLCNYFGSLKRPVYGSDLDLYTCA
jgi:hypothetical protein